MRAASDGMVDEEVCNVDIWRPLGRLCREGKVKQQESVVARTANCECVD